MKKSIGLIVAMSAVYLATAQCPEAKEGVPKSSDVTNAFGLCSISGGDSNKPVEAASYIERAIKHEKSKLKSKTWVYRGDIYLKMSELDENPCSDALSIAKSSYLKAKEMDTKGLKEEQIAYGLSLISNNAYNSGLKGYTSKDYDAASKNFELAAITLSEAGLQDSLYMYSLFNAALSFENAGNNEKAIAMYESCAETGYESKQCYYRMIGVHQNAENREAALATIQKGKELYPEESEFLIQETNYYLRAKEFEKAENNLNKAIDNDPTNSMLHFVLGTAMDQLGKSEGAVNAYKKAIELDENYLDAYHNIGANYVNKASDINVKINELDFRTDQAEIAKLEKQYDSAIKEAVPYLEKALELEPTNIQVMNSLKTIYFSTEEMDKYNDIKSRIDEAK